MNAAQRKIQRKIDKIENVIPMGLGKDNRIPWLKEKRPELFKLYNKLKRQYNQVWKDELVAFLDEEDTAPYEDFIEHLNDSDIQHCLPTGFTGDINAERKWIWQGKTIKGVPSGFMFPTVKMNPAQIKPDKNVKSPWVFVALKEDGTQGNYYYTEDFVKEQRQKKFMNVKDLLGTIDDIRSRWLRLIKRFDENDIETVAAVILELLFQFSARIGSEGNGTDEGVKTYGISTLRRKHYRTNCRASFLTYMGKDAVKTKHIIEHVDLKHICKILDSLSEDKKPSDPLFTYRLKNGKRKPVRSGVVNSLFKKLGGGECTVHKLRTYHATALAKELLDELYAKRKVFRKAKDAVLALTKIAEKVGKKLNHVRRTKEGKQKVTGATALANYIDTQYQRQFYEHYGVAFPKYLERML